ncbi:hypothetical protein TWF970_002495 [Orbilia oligospora]|uniref:Uncharacterized protein n=1 Tax=Orbilia oligospora TaxID=2813651 RepID=A0A7C8RF30_ORBOL|nr:hypothetical protein TWF970_002495 [Orbilia oligospora]
MGMVLMSKGTPASAIPHHSVHSPRSKANARHMQSVASSLDSDRQPLAGRRICLPDIAQLTSPVATAALTML